MSAVAVQVPHVHAPCSTSPPSKPGTTRGMLTSAHQLASIDPSPGRSTADGGSCALVNRGALWCADANAVIDDHVFLHPPDDSRHLPAVATVQQCPSHLQVYDMHRGFFFISYCILFFSLVQSGSWLHVSIHRLCSTPGGTAMWQH